MIKHSLLNGSASTTDERSWAWPESFAPTSPAAATVPYPREVVEPEPRARLVFSRGHDVGAGFAISTPRTTIGRGRDCDVAIDDATISRHHAELRRVNGRYFLENCGSLNGTYVNREPVQRAELVDGDEIWIGKARFTFQAGHWPVRKGR